MKKKLLNLCVAFTVLAGTQMAQAQTRYYDEVFTDSEIIKAQENVVYGINVDFLKNNNFYNPLKLAAKQSQIQAEHNEIRDSILSAIAAGTAPNIPSSYFTPYTSDSSKFIKLITPIVDNPGTTFNPFHMGMMDVYMPSPMADTVTDRPVIIYIHTGNFLPKGINGSVTGSKDDAAAVELCKQWAKRGYVAIAANYRLGWAPTNGSQSVRTRTLLNAVYRAIGDVKQVVRTVKSQSTALGIDPDKIALYGQGSGGYVALAYNFLDKYSETTLAKFDPEATGVTVIDTNYVGNIDGRGGLLNFYQYQASPNVDADVAFIVNAGGALGDDTWIDGGEAPNISFHTARDPFAPIGTGTVIVPTTDGLVVEADGANIFMPIVNNQTSNNDSFKNINDFNDFATFRARQMYGRTFTNDIPLIMGGTSITIDPDAEGLFVFDTEQDNSAPWDWYDEAAFRQYHGYLSAAGFAPPELFPADDIVDGQTGPNDSTLSAAYIDTIQQYMHRRMMVAMEIGDYQTVGVDEQATANSSVKLYPNPAATEVEIEVAGSALIETVEVYDLTGKVAVAQTTVNGNYYRLDIGALNSGIYLAKVKTSVGVSVERLVVE